MRPTASLPPCGPSKVRRRAGAQSPLCEVSLLKTGLAGESVAVQTTRSKTSHGECQFMLRESSGCHQSISPEILFFCSQRGAAPRAGTIA